MTMVASNSKLPASLTLGGGSGGSLGGSVNANGTSCGQFLTNENSNSSNETVIARLHDNDDHEQDSGRTENAVTGHSNDKPREGGDDAVRSGQFPSSNRAKATAAAAAAATTATSSPGRYSIKNLIHLAGQHLNVFHHDAKTVDSQIIVFEKQTAKQPVATCDQTDKTTTTTTTDLNQDNSNNNNNQQQQQQLKHHHLVFTWARRYLRLGNKSSSAAGHANSAPVTPIKWAAANAANQTASDGPGHEGGPRRRASKSNGYNNLVGNHLVGDRDESTMKSTRQPAVAAAGKHEAGCPRATAVAGPSADPEWRSPECQQSAAAAGPKPSVRFVDSNGGGQASGDSTRMRNAACSRGPPVGGKLAFCSQRQRRNHQDQVRFADCAVQTSLDQHQQQQHQTVRLPSDSSNANELEANQNEEDNIEEDDIDDDDPETRGIKLVARLFKLPPSNGGENNNNNNNNGDQDKPATGAGESPMDSAKFRDYGYKLIDYISNYLDTIRERRVTPLNIEPGYLKSRVQADAPDQGESFATIMHDFESHIMCGITHWQHPHFHAYFPAGNAYPSILADMLSDALGCVGFSWAASPAYTELEIIMLDWMGKMIGLPDEFLCLSKQESKGGGVIQGSASECVLVNLLAARHWAMERLRKKYPGTPDGLLLCKLVGYCSKEAHSCVEKASMIGFIKMRCLETDEKHSLRGETLARAIEADRAQGLEPFIVCATLGTTSCVSFDNLEELGQVCRRQARSGVGDKSDNSDNSTSSSNNNTADDDDDDDGIWLHVDAAYAGSALICPEFKYLMRGIEMASSFNMNPNKWMLINFDCSLMWVKDRFKLTRAFVVDPLYLQHSFSDQAIDYRHWGIPLSRRFRALKLWFVIRNYGVNGLREYIRNHVRLAKLFESLIREDKRFMVTNEVVLGLVCFRLVGSNALNQRLLSMINASGKLHMVPASLNGRYVIRFCVCDQNAKESDILYAYQCISEFATELFELIRAGKERIRAISQQNTIDISSISLHTQQSASADRLNGTGESEEMDELNTDGQQAGAAAAAATTNKQHTSNGLVKQGGHGGSGSQHRAAIARLLAKQQSLRGGARRSSKLGARANSSLASTTSGSSASNADTNCTPESLGQPTTATTTNPNKTTAPGSPSSATLPRSPLTKQVSMALASNNLNQPTDPQHQQQQQHQHQLQPDEEEDLDQEVPIESPGATGVDFDLDLDLEEVDDEDLPDEAAIYAAAEGQPINQGERSPGGELCRTASGGVGGDQPGAGQRRFDLGAQRGASETQVTSAGSPARHGRLSRGGRASRTFADDGNELEQEEAADEVYKLADKRHKMSLRYKREFFVRVVSDPRVYRASISGDIN